MIFFDNHKICEVKKYSAEANCSVMHLLKRLDQEELCNLLPVLPYLPTSHQKVAVSCIGAYALLKPELLERLCTFCTLDGVESVVVFPALDHVITSYTRRGVLGSDLVEFFTRLLTDFSLPPFASGDEEIGVCVRRYKREDMLVRLANEIGSAVVCMPFVAEELDSHLCIGLITAFENGDLHLRKKAAILHVLARGIQEKKFLTKMFTPLLDGFCQSLITYFLDIAPTAEAEDKKELLYPLFVTLVYSGELLSKVKKAATNNHLLALLCKRCGKFAETGDVERRPKEFHVGVHYAKQVERLIVDLRKRAKTNKRKRAN